MGGAGGVGTAAIQLAKSVYNARFVATTASPGDKTALCRRLGADVVVNYRDDKFEDVLSPPAGAGDDDEALFDYVLDTTGEVWRARNLVRRGGGVCSIIACPTVDGIRDWIDASKPPPGSVTFGVQAFLSSGWGGCVLNAVTGGRSMIKACESRGAAYCSVIGTGNGSIIADLGQWMADGKVRAVIDQQFDLKDSIKALEKLRGGRVAGKVVINIVGEEKEGGKM